MTGFVGTVLTETDRSIAAAVADKTIDPAISAGPVAALRELAKRIDGLDLDDLESRGVEVTSEMFVAALRDNVSLPTYLKACAELRLTPASRALVAKEPEAPVGKLAKLQAIPRPA